MKAVRHPLAVIDVGSHVTRLEIVQVQEGGGIETLERLSQTIPLGYDVFTNGRISNSNIKLVGAVLKDFARVVGEYGVSVVRAFATSAAREATNADLFISRVRQASGVDLRVIEVSEEARLLFLAMKRSLPDAEKFRRLNALVCVIGTGSTLIMFVRDGRLIKCEAVSVGSLRVVEELERPANDRRIRSTIEPFIATMAKAVIAQASMEYKPELFIAVGGTVRALCDISGMEPVDAADGTLVTKISFAKFEAVYTKISVMTPAEVAEKYGVDDVAARSVMPCCDIMSHFIPLCSDKSLTIPHLTTRDAVVQDIVREMSGDDDPFLPELVSCAHGLGQRYHYDAVHAANVAELSLEIFDGVPELHGLGRDRRHLLEVAALLHDIGLFVNNRSHHKHSHYLIRNSQLPGLSTEEREIVATIARYHRRSMPRASHPEYMQLLPEDRVTVCKLAAILRVADSLDFARKWNLSRISMSKDGKALEFRVEGPVDLALENWAVKTKADLFREVFGLRIILTSSGG